MATHSSVLAWRIPWTEEPGWLQSIGSHKSQTQLRWLSTHAWEKPKREVIFFRWTQLVGGQDEYFLSTGAHSPQVQLYSALGPLVVFVETTAFQLTCGPWMSGADFICWSYSFTSTFRVKTCTVQCKIHLPRVTIRNLKCVWSRLRWARFLRVSMKKECKIHLIMFLCWL